MKKHIHVLLFIIAFFMNTYIQAQSTSASVIPKLDCEEFSPFIQSIETATPNATNDIIITVHYFTSNMTATVTPNTVVNSLNFVSYDTISINVDASNEGIYTLTLINDCGFVQTDFVVEANTCLVPDNSGATVWQNVSIGNTTGNGTFSDTGTINGWSNTANFGSVSGPASFCFTVANHTGNIPIMIGLNNTPNTTTWTDIEHKFYLLLRPSAYTRLYASNGTSLNLVNDNGGAGDYNNDNFCIERDASNNITFYYNGTLIYPTSGTQASLITGDLYVSINAYYSGFWAGNIELTNIELCPK